jgi:hypothetical protein
MEGAMAACRSLLLTCCAEELVKMRSIALARKLVEETRAHASGTVHAMIKIVSKTL